MPLPSKAPASLSQPHLKINVGDVWWLPEEKVGFPGGKDRFCLIVALERPPGARVPARAHYVVGSTRSGGPPAIVVEAGEANLRKRTHFRFWWSGDIDLATLVEAGRLKGRLDPGRRDEIGAAVRVSNRSALKRLLDR
jgi:hypothetical protein